MNIKTRILLAVFLLEVIGYGLLLYYTHSNNRDTLVNVREKQIQATILNNYHRINAITGLMESKAIDLAKAGELIYRFKDASPLVDLDEFIKDHLVAMFSVFPESIGGGLWYEPFVFSKNKPYYGPYVFWGETGVEFTWDLNTAEYDYPSQDWYLTALPKEWPRNRLRPLSTYWTAPYWDEAGTNALMMTVDAVMHSDEGEIIGMSTVDWSLQEMTEFTEDISITETSKSFLIDFKSHKVLSNSIEPSTVMADYETVPWLKAMKFWDMPVARVSRLPDVTIHGEIFTLYYLKTDADMILGVLIPDAELYQEINEAGKSAIQGGALIVVFFIACVLIVLELLFRPFTQIKNLIRRSINIEEDGKLKVEHLEYPKNNEFTPIIDTLNLTYEKINSYTHEMEEIGKAKMNFLAVMSHEIRTPMNAVLGYTQLLALSDDFSVENREMLIAIEASSNHLLELINDILDISKIESGSISLKMDNVHLLTLIDDLDGIFKIRCSQKGLDWKINRNFEDDLVVYVDRSKLNQIVINLLGNAIKFTDSGSVVLDVEFKKEMLRLSVVDTGAGISEEHQENLFTPFYQGAAGYRYGGSGLGLTIVKSLVDIMGGDIKLLESSVKGSSFEMNIPMDEADELSEVEYKNESLKDVDFSTMKLTALVVDDVSMNRDILVKVLGKLGVASKEAVNGVEALEVMESYIPDLLFIDIQMPIMDGYTLIEKIKELDPLILPRTIAISANVFKQKKEYTDFGFCYALNKPFKVSDIIKVIKNIVSSI